MDLKTNRYRLFAFVAILLLAFFLAACGGAKTEEPEVAAKPSNSGGPGEAVNLKGDATNGAALFSTNCVSCHGEKGVGGVANPGSTDATVPELAPIDSTMVNSDYKTFATNIDLFIEHGSAPEGDNPTLSMAAFGDNKTLKPQEIADIIAYVISLNQK
jgi:mono/diheme cytochrome c family protein